MVILAEFDSDCDYCNQEIEEGTEIHKKDGWGWVHASAEWDCATAIDSEELAYEQRNQWNHYA